jgi:putative transcriptional regulator
MNKNESKVIYAMLKTAKDLDLSSITMKEIEMLNLTETKDLTANQIKKMRMREKLSQAVIAKILNVAPSTYQKWERGETKPSAATLKLLRLAYDHGVQYIIQ